MLRSLALTGVAVLLGTVAGCGGDSSSEAGAESPAEAYCSSLRSLQEDFRALQENPQRLNPDAVFSRVQGLADQAPPAVSKEWSTVADAIVGMRQALTDAGLTFADLRSPQALQQLDPGAAQDLARASQEFGGAEARRANEAITRHAKQECDIDLTRSSRS